jgi:hypothetical protein
MANGVWRIAHRVSPNPLRCTLDDFLASRFSNLQSPVSNPMLNRSRIILLLILFFQLVFGVLYAVRTPHWQAPDEPAHFNYVRVLAETGSFPVLQQGDYDQVYLEKIKSEKFPPELSVDSIRYEAHQPPLYYVIAAPVYLVARALNLDIVLTLRLLNVCLVLVLSLIAFRIFRYVFPANPLLRLVGVGILATLPMHIAMSAAINNDTLAEVVVAAILWISLLRLQGKMDRRRFFLIGGLVYGIALLTKTTIYSSIVLLIAAELGYQHIFAARQGASVARLATVRPRMRAILASGKTLLPLFLISFALSILWFVRNALTYGVNDLFGWQRHDLVVAGQPTTAQWIADNGLRSTLMDWVTISFRSFWAQFGWMGVLVDERIYVLLFVLSAAASFGALFLLIRLWQERRVLPSETRWTWLLLGLLLAVVVAADVYYNLKFFQPQGRYLFYALIPIAALWGGGLYELLNPNHARWVFVLLYVVMLGLDYVSLAWFIVPQLAS